MFPTHYTVEVIFGTPLIVWLFACFFKLDELVAVTPYRASRRRLTPRVDALGRQVCMDPDGRVFVPARKQVYASVAAALDTTNVISFRTNRSGQADVTAPNVDRRAA